MRGAMLGCLLLLCVVVLLAEQAEGHVTFFSPNQMRTMQKTLAKQKELGARSEDGTPEDTSVQPEPQEEPEAQGTKVEISIRLTGEQLDHVTEDIIKDVLETGAA